MALTSIELLDPKPFKNMIVTVGNLPSSFVDSMSYYEQLAWLCQYIQDKLIPQLNTNTANINEVIKEFTDLKAYVDEQVQEIPQLREDFTTFTTNITRQMELLQHDVEEYVDDELTLFRNTVLNLIQANKIEILNKIDNEVERLDYKIEHFPISNTIVFNPALGVFQQLQDCINFLTDYQRTEALTAKEYDDLELGAKTYDDYQITAIDYDNYAKSILTA